MTIANQLDTTFLRIIAALSYFQGLYFNEISFSRLESINPGKL